MNDKGWTTESQDRPAPWEQNFYQTGSIRPPKCRRGLLAVLLVGVIFLGGIISALSLLDIPLFRQQTSASGGDEGSLLFTIDQINQSETTDPSVSPETVGNGTDVQLKLNASPDSEENIPQSGGLSLQDIYASAIDSVVSISCTTVSGTSSGSGVVLSSDGYIVTNCHVVENATSIEILFNDSSRCSASVVGMDSVSDLAVLYVNATDLTPAEFGDSSALRVGDAVVAIGDPLGIELRGTMTDGIVSAINRDIITDGRTMTLIQTNAALNSGNSGGPLLNCYGQVIGINTMKMVDSASGVEGLGFAIPSTTVKEIVDQLICQGYVSGRPSLGFTGQDISSFEQLYYRIPSGIYITEVDPTGDAAAKGICAGDILLCFDDQRIADSDTLLNLLYTHNAGDTVRIVIYRDGAQYSLMITLGQTQ